jgi:ribose/xylose/arabinose/galactoside ABC-type transport system permease subunit
MKSRIFPLVATIIVFLILYFVGFQRFPAFGTSRVVANFLTDKAFLGVAAVGMTFVILSGGIDLSVGSVIAFTGVFCALMIENTGMHPLLVFALALALGAVFGATMGMIIHYLKIPPFIVTLAGMFLARGISFVLSEASIPIEHPFYEQISDMFYTFPDKGRVTVIAVIFILVLLVGIVLAHFTRFGRNIYAMGGDANSAMLLGVPIARTTIAVYTLSSVLATIAGIIYSLYTRSGYPLAAVGLELDAIAAVVVGGTLLTGGVGYLFGTFIGVMIQGVIQTYINFDGSLNSWWTKIVIGVLLLLFVGLQKLLSSRGSLFNLARKGS